MRWPMNVRLAVKRAPFQTGSLWGTSRTPQRATRHGGILHEVVQVEKRIWTKGIPPWHQELGRHYEVFGWDMSHEGSAE
jgi:hypothetical protein